MLFRNFLVSFPGYIKHFIDLLWFERLFALHEYSKLADKIWLLFLYLGNESIFMIDIPGLQLNELVDSFKDKYPIFVTVESLDM